MPLDRNFQCFAKHQNIEYEENRRFQSYRKVFKINFLCNLEKGYLTFFFFSFRNVWKSSNELFSEKVHPAKATSLKDWSRALGMCWDIRKGKGTLTMPFCWL